MVPAHAEPVLADSGIGTLDLVASSNLPRVDGLAFDRYANLFATLETDDEDDGGVVYVDKRSGVVTTLVTKIKGADQIEVHPSGDIYVTNEIPPASASDRLFRITLQYDSQRVPRLLRSQSVDTAAIRLNKPEGLIALPADGAFGARGELYVAEDVLKARVIRIDPSQNPVKTTVVVDAAAGLQHPEGMAFGNFKGAKDFALYLAETDTGRILTVDSQGKVAVFADGLVKPDNVEFGPDSFLYVSEELPGGGGRVTRIAADGTKSVFATGFKKPEGLVFDPENGDFYIAEQTAGRIWRVRFNARATLPGRTFPGIIKGRAQ